MKKLVLIMACSLFYATNAFAEYCATGSIQGNECYGFGISVCKLSQVDAAKGSDGRLYTIKRCYESVSEYSKSKGRCWIQIKSRGGGLLSGAINAAIQLEFYHKEADDSYESVDVEYLTFKCIHR